MSRGRDINELDKPPDDRTEPTARSLPATNSLADDARELPDDKDSRGRAGDNSPDRKRSETDRRSNHGGRSQHPNRERHEELRTRGRVYEVAPRDFETMTEIGKFRAVRLKDLEQFHFAGEAGRMNYDLGRLSAQDLIRRETVTSRRGQKLQVIALTRAGKALLERHEREDGVSGASQQRFHADIKKPAEIFHDTAIYRMYQAESQKIRSSGGKIRRVVLDYELKKNIYRPLAKARAVSPEEYERRQSEIAHEHDLTVTDGKILLPDLRIEYETREGAIARVDLELATDDYKASQLAAKRAAGFRIYFAGSDSSRGSVVRDERELTAEILYL